MACLYFPFYRYTHAHACTHLEPDVENVSEIVVQDSIGPCRKHRASAAQIEVEVDLLVVNEGENGGKKGDRRKWSQLQSQSQSQSGALMWRQGDL